MTGAGFEVKTDFFVCSTPQSSMKNLVKFRCKNIKSSGLHITVKIWSSRESLTPDIPDRYLQAFKSKTSCWRQELLPS